MSDPLPTPEEIQRKLAEFMKKEFGDRVILAPAPETEREETGLVESRPARRHAALAFDYKPKEIVAHLNRFVIRQDEAKKALAIAVCDHYNHVRACAAGRELPHYVKQNVLLIGPTGVGKTYLVKTIAELIGVPFVKADATKFSETGYVGGDVEDLVRELVHRADGDVQLAQYGIIYLDEIDKLAMPAQMIGRDVSGRGVQTNLLKLMEETEVPRRSPTDLPGQLQAALEFQRRGQLKHETINTKHILFIVSGAFDALPDIVRRRLRATQIGFSAPPDADAPAAAWLRRAQTEDFIQFGFEPEFIGRLPVRVVLEPLSVDDLEQILRHSEGSVIRQYEASFRAFGIDVVFSADGLRAIAEQAARENTGARGLLTVCERVLRDFKYELPSSPVRQLVVNRAVVEQPAAELQRILQTASRLPAAAHEAVAAFARRIAAEHGLHLVFPEETVAALVARATQAGRSVAELLGELFRDYPFGLNLIRQHTGQTEFVIPAEAVGNAEKFLGEWVVRTCRQQPPG